ncbi:hypothetical protein DIPPA_10095 [Diplonema papillatum]|nr:hypothetical protein DIPPA_10095 [Diplonema papillatum]
MAGDDDITTYPGPCEIACTVHGEACRVSFTAFAYDREWWGMHANPNLVVTGVNEDGDIALGCKIVAVNGKPAHGLNATEEALQGVSCEITPRDPLLVHVL